MVTSDDEKASKAEGRGKESKESPQSDPVMENFRKMLQGMEDRMLEQLDRQFEQVSQRCDDMERDYQKNVQTMDGKIQAVDQNVKACATRIYQLEGDVAENLGPQVEDAGRRVFAMEQRLDQIAGAQHTSAEDIGRRVSVMERRIDEMAGRQQASGEAPPGTSGISPSSEMNPHEFIAAIDNVIRSRTGNAEPSQENDITEGQRSRHARRRQQRQYEESGSRNMGDQRQDARVSQQFDRYPRYWGQTGNPGMTYPGPRFDNNRGGYSRPGQNLLDREDGADYGDIRSRIPDTVQSHGRDTASWQGKSRQRSSSVDSDSEEEEYRRDQKRSGRSYSRSHGKFGSGSRGYRDEDRTSVARGRRDSSDSSYERDEQRSRQTSHGRSYPSRSRASSEDSEDGFSQRRRRHRSPPLPKLPTFDGKPAEWKSFICQFRQRAKSCAWSRREKLDRLMACLRGKAVDYFFNRPKDLRADYYTLKDMLSQRYNIAELPGTARRQLNTMRQEKQESFEDYADRVLGKVSEAYPNVEEDVAQALGTESFLRGCRDRSAAYAASEHKPDTIYKALQCVKDAAANLRVFGRPAMTTRQVTFADPERESTTDGVARLSKEQEKMMQLMTEMMSRLKKTTSRRNTSPSPDRGRNRSPSPCYNCRERGHMARECPKPRRCFNCNKTGHMAEDCKEEKQGFGSPSVRKCQIFRGGE